MLDISYLMMKVCNLVLIIIKIFMLQMQMQIANVAIEYRSVCYWQQRGEGK